MINLIAVMMNLGYSETGAKTQKTVLAKKVLGMGDEAKNTFMFTEEEVAKILDSISKGKGKYASAASGALANPNKFFTSFTEEYVPSKPAKKKTKTKAEYIEENAQLKEEIEKLKAEIAELEEIINSEE